MATELSLVSLRCSPTGRAMLSVIIIAPDLALPRILGSTRTYKAELKSRKSLASTSLGE
jgi:hypothetical protein